MTKKKDKKQSKEPLSRKKKAGIQKASIIMILVFILFMMCYLGALLGKDYMVFGIILAAPIGMVIGLLIKS